MNVSEDQKIAVLLNRLDFHTGEIQRRQDVELRLFEWSTGLLAAVFAVVVALSTSKSPLPNIILIKSLATLLIAAPTGMFIYRILSDRNSQRRQAEIAQTIENELHLFDKSYYVEGRSLYPEKWNSTNSLPQGMMKRRTPVYYAVIMGIMLFCVVSTVWLVL